MKVEWFIGAKTNLAYNCLDRNIKAGLGEKIAFYFEGNDLDQQSTLTYQQLLDLVCKIANYLKSAGVKKGDQVTIYMPMICELPAAMVPFSFFFSFFIVSLFFYSVLRFRPSTFPCGMTVVV